MNNIKYLKEFNNILEKISENENLLEVFIQNISKILNTNICFIDKKGYIISEINKDISSFGIKNELTNEINIEQTFINQLNKLNELKVNINLENLYITVIDKKILENYFGVFIPIKICNQKLGTFILYKNEKFDDNLIASFEYIKGIIGILLYNSNNIQFFQNDMKKNVVKSAIDILSFTELEAILGIFEELNGEKEGLLIASKVADKKGLTRSVIVNALRKFESAGIIESRSLGMKGTYIKVLNEYLLYEIKKFKK